MIHLLTYDDQYIISKPEYFILLNANPQTVLRCVSSSVCSMYFNSTPDTFAICLRNQWRSSIAHGAPLLPLETQRWILTGELGNRTEGLDRTALSFSTESDCKPPLHEKQCDHGSRHQAGSRQYARVLIATTFGEECHATRRRKPGLVLSTRAVCRDKEPRHQLGILTHGSGSVRG